VDSKTGETLEWTNGDNNQLKQFLRVYPEVEIVDAIVPTVKLGIVINGHVMHNDINPMGIDNYPFVPIVTYYSPEILSYDLRLQGIVRGLRDAQFLYNRRKVIELDTLESQVNSGFIYKENALVNPKDVFQSGQGKGIALKQNAQMTDVQQIPAPQIPPTTLELSRILAEEIQQISGVSDELLGAAQDDKAGILSMLRQGASLTTLQGLFDRLDYSQKLLYKIILKAVQNNFTTGKVQRIIEEEVQRIIEEEPSPQFYNKFFGVYDCAVEAGVLTTTQKQMSMAQGLQLREAGIQIPDSFFIDNMTIQNKAEIKEAIEQQQQQQQQMEQQQQQVQQQELMSRAKLSEARVEEQMALANERNTRSVANIALGQERRMESIKDLEQAKLDKLKQLVEIEKLDIDTVASLLNVLKQLNEPMEQQIKQDASAQPQQEL